MEKTGWYVKSFISRNENNIKSGRAPTGRRLPASRFRCRITVLAVTSHLPLCSPSSSTSWCISAKSSGEIPERAALRLPRAHAKFNENQKLDLRENSSGDLPGRAFVPDAIRHPLRLLCDSGMKCFFFLRFPFRLLFLPLFFFSCGDGSD